MVSLRFYFRNGISVETGLYSFCRLCSRVSATVHFWERSRGTWADEGERHDRSHADHKRNYRPSPPSLLIPDRRREGDGGGGLSDVSVRLEGRTDDRLAHGQEVEEVSTQENQRKVGLNRLINNRKCIYTAL